MGTKKLLLVRTLLIVLILFQITPIAKALWDDNLARKQFPLLSNLESPWELERWTGDAVYGITNKIKNGHN